MNSMHVCNKHSVISNFQEWLVAKFIHHQHQLPRSGICAYFRMWLEASMTNHQMCQHQFPRSHNYIHVCNVTLYLLLPHLTFLHNCIQSEQNTSIEFIPTIVHATASGDLVSFRYNSSETFGTVDVKLETPFSVTEVILISEYTIVTWWTQI